MLLSFCGSREPSNAFCFIFYPMSIFKKIPSWSVWVLVVFAWAAYNYLFDDTRQGHPNYSKQQHPKCLKTAIIISNEAFDEAIADPSKWELAGYKSAQDLAITTKDNVYSRCMK